MKEHYAFIDTETGGFDPNLNPVMQLACVITDEKFNKLATFCSYVKPFMDFPILDKDAGKGYKEPYISKEAVEVHGILPGTILTAPSEVKVLTQLGWLLDEYRGFISPVAYNLAYDISMIEGMCCRNDMPSPAWNVNGGICFMKTAKKQVRCERYRLSDVAAHFGIQTSGAHDALADVEMTIAIGKKIYGYR